MEGYGNENPGAFQSTRPLRGATRREDRELRRADISTHAPLAGRDTPCREGVQESNAFQPTRPLRGATGSSTCGRRSYCKFQPTRPLRGATTHELDSIGNIVISTHAPLAGRDLVVDFRGIRLPDFNPRAPCGARQISIYTYLINILFQPTRPLRGATAKEYKSLCTFLR